MCNLDFSENLIGNIQKTALVKMGIFNSLDWGERDTIQINWSYDPHVFKQRDDLHTYHILYHAILQPILQPVEYIISYKDNLQQSNCD